MVFKCELYVKINHENFHTKYKFIYMYLHSLSLKQVKILQLRCSRNMSVNSDGDSDNGGQEYFVQQVLIDSIQALLSCDLCLTGRAFLHYYSLLLFI